MIRKLLTAGLMLGVLSWAGAAPAPVADGAFPVRGLKGLWWAGIEKYYKAVPWMGDHNMNWLMLCYTAYPESGKEWRKDYTPEHLAEMKELVTRAGDRGITVCLSFNPGIWSNPPLNHSSEEDYQASWRKVKDAHKIGIYEIALCLDDIKKDLVPEDKAKHGTLQAAQVAYTNRLWADMKTLNPRPKLIFCPSAYTTGEIKKHLDYTKYVGENLDREIEMFWTGPTVCSTTITVADAQEVEALYKRKPFIWDNYPVNDMFPWRPLLAPLKGRDPKLPGAVSGILFNPMMQWELNRIPLVSVANYLADPVGYDASKESAKILADFSEAERPAIELLLKHYGSAFWGDPNFPPGIKPQSLSAVKDATTDLNRLKALMTAETSTLRPMWDDIKDTVEADLKTLAHLGEGPVTMGDAMKGGAPKLAQRGFGTAAGLVYAKPTGKHLVTATLNRQGLDGAPRRLTLFARNSDTTVPKVRIAVNDVTLVEGPVKASQEDFELINFDLPEALAKEAGELRLSIENLETSGTSGMPPWFAVKWAQLRK